MTQTQNHDREYRCVLICGPKLKQADCMKKKLTSLRLRSEVASM